MWHILMASGFWRRPEWIVYLYAEGWNPSDTFTSWSIHYCVSTENGFRLRLQQAGKGLTVELPPSQAVSEAGGPGGTNGRGMEREWQFLSVEGCSPALFFVFGNSETFSGIEYAAPLAVNGMIRCDLGFCPKVEWPGRNRGWNSLQKIWDKSLCISP